MSTYFSGYFNKGEVDTPIVVQTAKQFKNIFGTATAENYNDWYQAYNYLQYSSNLLVSRSILDGTNSYSGYPTQLDVPVKVLNTEDWNSQFSTLEMLPHNLVKFIAKTPGDWGNGIQIAIITKLEYDANYVIYDDITAQQMISYMEPDDYAIFIIRNKKIVETFVKSHDALHDLNNESLYIYVKSIATSPILYHDGNQFLFDSNGVALYDGNYPYFDGIPVAYGEGIITLDFGEQTAPTEDNIKSSYELVESKEDYELKYIIANERNHSSAINLANTRKDCIAFVGAPNIALNKVIDYRISLGDTPFSAFIGEYKRQLDNFSGKYRWINIAGDIAGLKSKSDNENAEWFAGAGLSRGVIQNCSSIKHKPSKKMQDAWYQESVNSISFYASRYYLNGQKTMVYRASPGDRVNVRALFNKLESDIEDITRINTFDINDVFTRNRTLSSLRPYLDKIKAGRGIYNYKLICDETNNTRDVIQSNQFIVDIIVQPTIVAEYIRLRFHNTGTTTMSDIMTRSGVVNKQSVNNVIYGGVRPPSIPANALLAEDGLPIFTQDDNFILV